MSATIHFIGQIKTPYRTLKECPNNIQSDGPICQITLNPEFHRELAGLEAGQNILILYWLGYQEQAAALSSANPCTSGRGTFALRTPCRPNPIGAAVLPIETIENGQITVRGLDCLDNTQLLDIKPAIYQEGAIG